MTMLVLSEDIHSLSDFKRNTNEYVAQMEDTGRPVVLTVNGKAKLVVQNAESYQALMEAVEEAKTLRALLDAQAGKGRPASEFFEEQRKKYGFPAKRPKTRTRK